VTLSADAFAAGKMGVKLATKAPKAMKAIKTALAMMQRLYGNIAQRREIGNL
jgi:hypothetical protein